MAKRSSKRTKGCFTRKTCAVKKKEKWRVKGEKSSLGINGHNLFRTEVNFTEKKAKKGKTVGKKKQGPG